ncbi:MAG TPA: discoidin domain-containing protein [Candidatus Udaeobacter sp.]|nr:discoidin domain-containing protein [Candidatus Udaeobacter sp.]
MKRSTAFHFKDLRRRLLALFVIVCMVAALAPAGAVSAEESGDGGTVSTGFTVEINEKVSNGFTHPGVGVTKAILENMRTQVLAQKEPWYSYYKAMTVSSSASKTVTSSNESSTDPTKPAVYAFDSQGFNSRFIADGLKAYTQALMYYITGDETYRANAMHIIRIWSQMDPAKYKYFTDSHIHTGIPLNRMVTAAEILRYSSYQTEELKWTDKDTADFTNNLINPVIETFQHENNHFMNQHNYPLLGAMAGYIFTENRERYNEAVEWATVNKTAVNQGFNGSIKQLFRLVDTNAATGEKLDKPVVQHVEMGRDQAHGAGDLTNSAILSRMFLAQATKVDPVEGTVSTADNAVGYYEFLDDRFLTAADFFWKYMLGYETSWVPVPFSTHPDGTTWGIYQKFSDSYRGRTNTALFWDMYYYYTYVKGVNVAEKAPYFYEAFTKRSPSNYYYKGAFSQAWDSVDGGGDFWVYIPKEAESEGAKYLPKEQPNAALVEPEERYTAFDDNTATVQEGNISYVEFMATPEGSKIAVQNLSYADRTNSRLIGLKFRTDGTAKLELSKEIGSTPYQTLTLPDTKGQWKYVTYDMGISSVSYGQLDGDYSLVYTNVKGAGTKVDIDHFNVKAGEQLTPPVFTTGKSDLNIVAFTGAPVTLDFAATDSGTADVIAYELSNKPEGAEFNTSTGAFSWQPVQAGTYSFIAQASDGTTLTTKNVNIAVTNDRASAVAAATAVYHSNMSYVTSSLNHYQAVYNETMSQIETASNEAFYQQLASLRSAAESLQLLTPSLKDGSMDYTNIVTSTFGNAISLLVDGNDNTFPGYTLAPYPNLYHILDFGPDYKVSADAFAFEGRMNFTDRMAGMTVFGSNDGDNWTRITSGQTPFVDDMTTLNVDDAYKNAQFRLIKIEMINPQPDVLRGQVLNLLELSEFRIIGERHETNNKLESVSIGSDQSINGRIVLGSTVKLTIKAKEPINSVKVNIQGQDATVSTQDNINWTAAATLSETAQTGAVKFAIDYIRNDGTNGETTYFTTDNSKLYLVDESDLIRNVVGITKLIDSTASAGRTAAETLKQTNYLFDNNTGTSSDYRLNGGGSGSYITFDFEEGNQVALSGVEVLARQDNNLYSRIRGAVVQGSNDNTTWTTLSKAALSIADWQTLAVSGAEPYRYIRMFNPNGWFGNMAELRLHGVVKAADVTPPVTTDDAPQGWAKQDTKVSFNAADADSSVAATHFTVDGGAQQTGNEVTLTAEGTHTLVYWSVDFAGNVEQPHTVSVNIDKTAPESIASVSPAIPDGSNGWYTSDVTVSLDVSDHLSGVAKTEYQINDGSWVTYTDSIPAFGDGIYTVNYRSTDLAGHTEQLKTVEFKVDKTAPELSVQLDQTTIWPANHKMGTVNVTLHANDAGSGVESVILTSITCNQPDTGLGDIEAAIGTEATSFSLRAEKDRIYTIIYTATDKAGNKKAVTATVTVPHDLS